MDDLRMQPSLDAHADRLGLEIISQYLTAHLAAPARLFIAAKGQRGLPDIVAIYPDRTGPQLMGGTMGPLDAAGPKTRGQIVYRVVGAANQFIINLFEGH